MPRNILTHHARERMAVRRVTQAMMDATIAKPDGREAEDDGDTQFFRRVQGRKVHVVAKPLDNRDWLIKTVWVDGEDDPHPLRVWLVTWWVRLRRRK